jgi:hypothetical protein
VLEDVPRSGNAHVLSFKEKDEISCNFLVDTIGVHSPVRKSLLSGSQLSILPFVVFTDGSVSRNFTKKDLMVGMFSR